MRIGVLSDTHGLLRPEILDILRTCDRIFHAGDIGTPAVLDNLRDLAPTYAVRGNCDREWAAELPETLTVTVDGIPFAMAHRQLDVPNARVRIFGHSHRYQCREPEGALLLNPGACGPRRFDQEITMAVLTTENGRLTVEKITVNPSTERN